MLINIHTMLIQKSLRVLKSEFVIRALRQQVNLEWKMERKNLAHSSMV